MHAQLNLNGLHSNGWSQKALGLHHNVFTVFTILAEAFHLGCTSMPETLLPMTLVPGSQVLLA